MLKNFWRKDTDMKTAYFTRFELRLSDEAVNDIARPGDAEPAVLAHMAKPGSIEWNDKTTPENIRAELAEYGAWDAEELAADDERNKVRIVWIAAGNIREEEYNDRQNYN